MSDASFSERLARIQSTNHGRGFPPKESAKPADGPVWATLLRNALFPLTFVGAFFVGIFSGFLSLMIRGQMMPFDPRGDMGDYYFIVNYLIGQVVAFVMGHMLGINTKILAPAQTLGIFLTLAMGHNLAHWVPETSAKLFSDNWVDLQLMRTSPNTLKVRGLVFKFGDESADPTALAAHQPLLEPRIPGAQVVLAPGVIEGRKISGARFIKPEPETVSKKLCERLHLGC